MATKVCEYYSYGNCTCQSGFLGKGVHILMGCEYTKEDGMPSAIRQKRHCQNYKEGKVKTIKEVLKAIDK